MFENIKKAFTDKDIRKKILLTVLFIVIYRLGCFIPVPGIDVSSFAEYFKSSLSYLGIMNAITGGSLSQGTLLALGVGPYINASIIIQLLTAAIPSLEKLSKQGEEGRKKIEKITRYLTIGLAIIQATGIVIAYKSALDTAILSPIAGENYTKLGWLVGIFVVIMLTAGSSFTMWIGERITEYGVSNGMSMLIFVGIISTAASSIANAIAAIASGNTAAIGTLIGFLVLVVIIFGGIVFMDGGERRIPVQYAKQVKGRKMYGGQSTHIPIRINASGVLPLIFAYAIINFPTMLASMFWPEGGFVKWWGNYVGGTGEIWVGKVINPILLGILIIFFAYFYSSIQFDPREVSKNMQENGGFILGIRPGYPTAEYLGKVSTRLTLIGALFLAILAIVPSLIFGLIGASSVGLLNAFSATGMLICVSVALEFNKAIESQLLMKQFRGFLK